MHESLIEQNHINPKVHVVTPFSLLLHSILELVMLRRGKDATVFFGQKKTVPGKEGRITAHRGNWPLGAESKRCFTYTWCSMARIRQLKKTSHPRLDDQSTVGRSTVHNSVFVEYFEQNTSLPQE